MDMKIVVIGIAVIVIALLAYVLFLRQEKQEVLPSPETFIDNETIELPEDLGVNNTIENDMPSIDSIISNGTGINGSTTENDIELPESI
jgi:hypothetical protein